MEYISYFTRFLYRIRWYLLAGTLLVALLAYWLTRNLPKLYYVEATVYTGVVSGYSIDPNASRVDWAATQNTIDNLINIMRSESTLQNVSVRLYARNMIHGNMEQDNEYILASNYRWMYDHVKNSPQGKEILALIDKSSEDKTVENLKSFIRPTKDNYIYGLFHYNHPHYSRNALNAIKVTRRDASDLLNVSYASGDPGITYNTIQILMDEFVNEYRAIRYGETDKVIAYFKAELERIGKELRKEEDDLMNYNIDKRVINYLDETKEIAAINKEFELREQDVLFAYNSSKAMLEEIEKQLDINAKQLLNNLQFISKLKEASTLTAKISELESLSSSTASEANDDETLLPMKEKLNQSRKELSRISDYYISGKHTKEGVNKTNIVEEWLNLTLQYEKAKAELGIITQSRNDLNDKYRFYAPVGSELKRRERSINFTEQSYLSTQKSYHDALMRKKNLEMTSATIKVLNPPSFPINAEPTKRKMIVMIATLCGFLGILGIFLLIELLDRTLRDSLRGRRLTGLSILGAYPAPSQYKYRKFNKECEDMAVKHMSSSILRYFNERKEGYPYIVNFLSTETGDGKSYLAGELNKYWSELGLKVGVLSWNNPEEINADSRTYMLAKSVSDLSSVNDKDIMIIEHKYLKENNVPEELLQEANVNVLIARADRGWTETDKLVLAKAKKQVADAPMFLYLNKTRRYVLEDFTGMLPPYTFLRQQMYRLSQLALTEKMTIPRFRKSTELEEEEDE